jgi:hypothetical protein
MTRTLVQNEGALDQTARNAINMNAPDISLCVASVHATSGTTGTTLTNISGLSTDVLPSGTYKFEAVLGTVATANSGLKLALKQSVASMVSAIEYEAVGFAAAGLVCQRGTTTTDQASILASTTAIIHAVIRGTVTLTKAGRLQLQFAQNASHADTTSVFLNSIMTVTPVEV